MSKAQHFWYFGVGSLHNDESSVDGGKYIRLPLMQELLHVLNVHWIGFERNEQVPNNYVEMLGRAFPAVHKSVYTINVRAQGVSDDSSRFIETIDGVSSLVQNARGMIELEPGPLFIEMRPNIVKEGYNFQNEWRVQLQLIDLFDSLKLPIFVWDQDVWAEQLPDEYRKKVCLLRSYFSKLDDSFTRQELFLYGWRDQNYECHLSELTHARIFDACYCGNVYGRRNEFLEYFKPFEEQKKKVCVQGNWLRKKYDDRDFALDNFPSFMFFGRTPHWTTMPTCAMSKSVIQFSNEDQQRVGLPTARIFEALMGKSVVFCSSAIKHIDRIVPEELIVDSGADLIKRWNMIDRLDSWEKLRKLFEKKLKTNEFSYASRVKSLMTWIDEWRYQ